MFFRQDIEGLFRLILRREALDDPHPGHILVDKRIQIGTFLSECLPLRMRVYLNEKHAKYHERRTDQRCRRKLWIFGKHDANDRDHRDHVRDQRRHTVGKHIL